MRKNKKAQVSKATGTLIPLVVGVGVAVLVLIFMSSLGGQVWETVEDDVDTIGDQSATVENRNLSLSSQIDPAIITGTLSISNTTSTVPLENFEIDYDAGTLHVNNTDAMYNNSLYNISYEYYNYTIRNSIRGATVNSFDALEQTANYMPLIVLAVVIGVVLLIVLGLGVGGNVYGKNNGGSL